MTLARLARRSHRRRLVVVLWIVGFVTMNALGATIGNAYSDNFRDQALVQSKAAGGVGQRWLDGGHYASWVSELPCDRLST